MPSSATPPIASRARGADRLGAGTRVGTERRTFRVSDRVRDGDELTFKATVRLSFTKRFEGSGLLRVTESQLGSVAGRVVLALNYPRQQGGSQFLKRAVVELRPGRAGSPVRVVVTGPDGNFRFDGLPQGTYVVAVTSFKHHDFPSGYRLKEAQGPWFGASATIPQQQAVLKAGPRYRHVGSEARQCRDRTGGAGLQGFPQVRHRARHLQGTGRERVTVMANRLGSEGGGTSVVSGGDGAYRLPIRDLPGGTYWIRAEKYVVPRWAGPDDLLDVASNKEQRNVLFPCHSLPPTRSASTSKC